MKNRYYLAYGSNLNIPQMEYRCPTAKVIGTAAIPNYQLLFKGSKTGSYLTIEPKEGCSVPVAVWSVKEPDERRLDAYEGYPHFYYKKELRLPVTDIETGTVQVLNAFVYIMHEERPLGTPSKHYLQVCCDGYDHFGFDPQYLVDAFIASSNLPTPGVTRGERKYYEV